VTRGGGDGAGADLSGAHLEGAHLGEVPADLPAPRPGSADTAASGEPIARPGPHPDLLRMLHERRSSAIAPDGATGPPTGDPAVEPGISPDDRPPGSGRRPPIRPEERAAIGLATAQIAGLLTTATAVAIPSGALASVIGILATLLVLVPAAALFALAARRARPRREAVLGWSALALADLVLALGLVLSQLRGTTPDAEAAVPARLLWSVLTCLAVWLLAGDRAGQWRHRWYDGLSVAFGAAAVAVALLAVVGVPQHVEGGDPAALSAVAALAAMTVAVVAAALIPAAGPRWLAAGTAIFAAAELSAVAAAGDGASAVLASLVDLLRLTGCAIASLAALPAELAMTTPIPQKRRVADLGLRRLTWLSGVALPAASVACSMVIVVLAVVGVGVPPLAALLGLAAVVLGLPRLARALREGTGLSVFVPSPGATRTDDLTGLANRRAVSEALSAERGHTEAVGWPGSPDRISLLLVDLDRFKDVNDALGHQLGDKLLTEVGARLRGVLRPNQLLARLGGDEFAVVLPGAGLDPARRVARELRGCLEQPFVIGGNRLHVRASVGIASCRLPRDEPTDLLRQADVAMYHAKVSSGIEVYDPRRDENSAHRLRRIDELRHALERGDLEVHLQPQVDLRRRTVVGAEALARWRHPQDGVLLPASFLPLAAQTGLMRPVAALVLDRALAACATWWQHGHHVPVSVNLTPDDLHDPDLPGLVLSTLRRHALPASALRVEITEDALVTDAEAAAALLQRWRGDGISVSIDDYGTGYSSLAYLRELPVDEIKLDAVFVTDLGRRTTATIVRHTVAMAHGLRMRVVAEGVEDAPTADLLAELGCDVGQGLYFGAAMSAESLLDLLSSLR
jgi:diguanylate cyclase (GGDEF)-like protein